MALELTLNVSMAYAKGTYSQSFSPSTFQLTITGTRYLRNVQNIGTDKEALEVGDLATPGFMLAINRDETNYVELYDSMASAIPFAKLKAGEPCLVRLGCAAPAAKANTAAINLEYFIVED